MISRVNLGTGSQVLANTNTPKSVVNSAIIYCLRCLVDQEIPLNQGALNPISIVIPEGSILYPDDFAAVVGGNVLKSQRLCDVIFKAFEACAASQGCCNNVTSFLVIMKPLVVVLEQALDSTEDLEFNVI